MDIGERSERSVEAIEDGKIVRVSERYARREGLLILRKQEIVQDSISVSDGDSDAGSIEDSQRKVEAHVRDIQRGMSGFEELRRPLDWRKNQIINELIDREVVRMRSPFPENMIYANWSYNVANFNVTKSREIMQSMGFGVGWDTSVGGINEADWTSASFATYTYSYNIGNRFKEDLAIVLMNSLDLIGINVIDDGLTWGEFLDRLFGFGGDPLQLYWLGWISDYNDPHALADYFFTNRSSRELSIPFYDYMVQAWTEEALIETDASQRNILYGKIQKRLVEELYPWAFCYVPMEYVAYSSEISGFRWN